MTQQSITSEPGSFQVLEIPQNVERKTRILACVVPDTNSTNPFDTYSPLWDNPLWDKDPPALKELEKAVDHFWKPSKGVQLKNVTASRGSAAEDEGKVKVTEALQAYGHRVIQEDVKIVAGEAEIYTIDNAGRAIPARLGGCKPWMRELQDLYDNDVRVPQKRKFYIVTGLYTTKKMEVSWKKAKSTGGGASVAIPGEAIVTAAAGGAPVPNGVAKILDTEVKYERIRESDTDVFARINQEIIFAVRYHRLDLVLDSPTRQKRAGFWSRLVGNNISDKSSDASTSPTIKSVSLGPPVRELGNLTSYGNGGGGEFYWKPPVYIRPERKSSE